ncbi:MAG TPA: anti-sigma factor [Geminicoccaceae bacterium]|nr:anti-sigma factor [Geminicoccaceae bacterium]
MTDELDETEALAAECVLGTLEPTARAAVRQRLRTDPELARLVELWEQRLGPLAAIVPPVEPPPAAWLGIVQALAAETRSAAPVRRVRVRHHGPLYSVTFWRRCTFGAGALAAILALYLAGTELRRPPPATARYVAVLDRSAATPALIVTVDPAAGRATIRPLAVKAAPDRALELWLIEGQGRQPRSLGLLDAEKETTLELPASINEAVRPSAAFAVSLEPRGGSPTGQPSGPVICQGPVLALGK